MNCCDSWRHISDTEKLERCRVEVKQTSLSLHRHICRWSTATVSCHLMKDEETVWFTSLPYLIIISSKMGVFLLQNCMFLPVWSCSFAHRQWGPVGPEQEAKKVKGKAEEKKASSCVAGLLWQCRTLQVSRDFKYGSRWLCLLLVTVFSQTCSFEVFLPQKQKRCDVELQQHRFVLVMVSGGLRCCNMVVWGNHHTAHGESSRSLRKPGL